MKLLEVLTALIEMGEVPVSATIRAPSGLELSVQDLTSSDWSASCILEEEDWKTESEYDVSDDDDDEDQDTVVIQPTSFGEATAALRDGITKHGSFIGMLTFDGIITAIRDRVAIADNRFKNMTYEIEGESK